MIELGLFLLATCIALFIIAKNNELSLKDLVTRLRTREMVKPKPAAPEAYDFKKAIKKFGATPNVGDGGGQMTEEVFHHRLRK
jgi:hypothetical protein